MRKVILIRFQQQIHSTITDSGKIISENNNCFNNTYKRIPHFPSNSINQIGWRAANTEVHCTFADFDFLKQA